MAVLPNISVALADLKAIRPDILNFQYETESDDFAEEILRAKTTLYRMVKDNERLNQPSLTEAELTELLIQVKDVPDVAYLKERLVLLCIAEVFKSNDMFDTTREYADYAKAIKLVYYLDEDEDSIITEDEERQSSGISFGR